MSPPHFQPTRKHCHSKVLLVPIWLMTPVKGEAIVHFGSHFLHRRCIEVDRQLLVLHCRIEVACFGVAGSERVERVRVLPMA